MADYYCDHGAYGTGSGILGAVPTWGVPQEGDGLALAPSASASVGSIVLAGQPTSGQIFSVGGVNFTAGSSFTIGASVDATCNNLASSINNSTATCSTSIMPSFQQLKNVLYARGPSGGAPAGTVQVMWRVGSVHLNAHVNNQITSTFTPTPTINQFAGGTSGCFGYFVNDVLVGAFNAGTYGVLIGVLLIIGNGGSPNIHDTVYVRSGTNKTVSPTFSSNVTSSRTSFGSLGARVVIDTNTKWTGDSDTGVLTVAPSFIGTSVWTLQMAGVGATANYASTYFQCLRRGNLKFSPAAGSGRLDLQVAKDQTTCEIDGVTFQDNSTSSTANIGLIAHGQSSHAAFVRFLNCDYVRSVSQTTIPTLVTLVPTNSGLRCKFEGCTFTYNISGTSDPGALFAYAAGLNTLSPHAISFVDCQFIANGYAGGLTMFPAGQPSWVNTISTAYDIRFENCTGLKMPTAYSGLLSTSHFPDQDQHSIYINLMNNGFRHENKRGVADWLPTENFPHLGAKLPDGQTDWCLRGLWVATGILNESTPYTLPSMRIYNRLSTAARTVKVEMLGADTLTYTDRMMRMTVNYTDQNGKPRCEHTHTISTSAVTWSSMTNLAAKKMEMTTSYQILTNSEVSVKIDFIGPPSSGSNTVIYFHPEPVLT